MINVRTAAVNCPNIDIPTVTAAQELTNLSARLQMLSRVDVPIDGPLHELLLQIGGPISNLIADTRRKMTISYGVTCGTIALAAGRCPQVKIPSQEKQT
jgi:hypothetical protein